jgi:ribosome biogenesis GTPase
MKSTAAFLCSPVNMRLSHLPVLPSVRSDVKLLRDRLKSIMSKSTRKQKPHKNQPEKTESGAPAPVLLGTVLRAGGGFCEVDPETDPALLDAMLGQNASGDAPTVEAARATNYPPETPLTNDRTLLCSLRGLLKQGPRRTAQPVSVGDRVRVRVLESMGPSARGQRLREGIIEEVLPRRSALARSRYHKTSQVTVANLDQVVIVMALRDPEINLHRLDRFLVLAEAADLRAVICLNKSDLLKPRERKKITKPLLELYNGLGYHTLVTSAELDDGIEEVRAQMRGHISAFIGSSGVGKSSLINAVQPGLHLWVGDVMEIGKGRHTTTEVSLHPLTDGGYLADTPGVKTVALLEREDVDVAQCFPEFAAWQNNCRFNNCTHDHEPGCAIRAATENGEIVTSRYESYVRMLRDPVSLLEADKKS